MSVLNMKMISILLILVCMDSFTLGRGWRGNRKIRGPLIKKIINTTSAAAAVGPYSQAVVVGRTVYVSGQIGINATSGQLVNGAQAQTEQALRNMEAILNAAGGNLTNVVKTTMMLADANDFGTVNGVYRTFFTSKFPARSSFEVASLPIGALVEIEAIAVLGPRLRRRRPRPFPRKYRPRPYPRRYRPRSHRRHQRHRRPRSSGQE